MKKFALILAGWFLTMGLALAQLNINSATVEQLDGLKGIGPTKAQAIVDYRKKNGPFKSVDDLQNVPGIGPATLKDLRGDVMIAGASRVPASADKPTTSKAEPAAPKVAPEKLAAPAAPAMSGMNKPAAPANPAAAPAKPAAPASAPAKPEAVAKPTAPAMPAKPAAPAAPAKPAAPAQPAQPATPASK